MFTQTITPNLWPEGPPVYDTNPRRVSSGKRPEPDQRTLNGIVIPTEEALRLSKIYVRRLPMWSLGRSGDSYHKGLFVARLILGDPDEPITTPYILMGNTPEEEKRIRDFFEQKSFKKLPTENPHHQLYLYVRMWSIIGLR